MTIRERVAEFDALTKAHPDERYICLSVTADRSALLVAGDALAAEARYVRALVFRGKQLAATPGRRDEGARWLGDALNRLEDALAAWKAATG